MKSQSLWALVALFYATSCQNKAPEVTAVKLSPADSVLAINPSAEHPFLKVSVGLKQDFEQAKSLYKEALTIDSSVFKMDGKSIILTIPGKTPLSISLTSFPESTETEDVYIEDAAEFLPTYKYMGCHTESKIHILEEQAFESISYIPVHEQFGVLPGEVGSAIKYDYLLNMPKFSPNGKFMMVSPIGNNEMDEQRTFLFYKNNIEVAQMGGGRFLEVDYELKQPKLIVFDAYWLDDHVVIAKVMSAGIYDKISGELSEKDFFYLKISLP